MCEEDIGKPATPDALLYMMAKLYQELGAYGADVSGVESQLLEDAWGLEIIEVRRGPYTDYVSGRKDRISLEEFMERLNALKGTQKPPVPVKQLDLEALVESHIDSPSLREQLIVHRRNFRLRNADRARIWST